MDISKILMAFLLLVKALHSESHRYCDHNLFKTNGLSWIETVNGERFSYPTEYKRRVIDGTNKARWARCNSSTPMNYVNWDNELEKLAINLLKKNLVHGECTIKNSEMFPCLVRTPLKKNLFVMRDKTTNKINLSKPIEQLFNLTTSDAFSKIVYKEPNITSVGCSIYKIQRKCFTEELRDHFHLLCVFDGISEGLLPVENEFWANLHGHNYSIDDLKYGKLEDDFNIGGIDIYGILYGLNVLIYSSIIMSYVFLKSLKSYHTKLLLSDVECDLY